MLALAQIFDLAPAAPMAMRRRQRAVGLARRSEEPHRALLVLARSWPLAGTAGYLDAVGDASRQLRDSAALSLGRYLARCRAWHTRPSATPDLRLPTLCRGLVVSVVVLRLL